MLKFSGQRMFSAAADWWRATAVVLRQVRVGVRKKEERKVEEEGGEMERGGGMEGFISENKEGVRSGRLARCAKQIRRVSSFTSLWSTLVLQFFFF